jgi:hypothetical protein
MVGLDLAQGDARDLRMGQYQRQKQFTIGACPGGTIDGSGGGSEAS